MPICIMNQNTALSGLGCEGSNTYCAIAIQPNIPTSKATSASVSAFFQDRLARRDVPHPSDRKILEGYSERVGEDELRHVFGKMNASEQRKSETKNDQWTTDVADDTAASAMGRRQKDPLPVRLLALHGWRVGRHWPPHGAVEPEADQWKIKACDGPHDIHDAHLLRMRDEIVGYDPGRHKAENDRNPRHSLKPRHHSPPSANNAASGLIDRPRTCRTEKSVRCRD